MRTLATFAAAFMFGIASMPVTPAFAGETIVLMRHAEKPADGRGQITCRGLNRSLALPSVLLKKFGKPDAIYAPNPSVEKFDSGVKYAYVRPLATIEPTAVRVGLPVHVQWGYTEIKPLESALLAPEQRDATIFIAWEHKVLVDIAKDLLAAAGGNAEQVPSWDYADFDTLYVIRIKTDSSGKRDARFEAQKQGLNDLSEVCQWPDM